MNKNRIIISLFSVIAILLIVGFIKLNQHRKALKEREDAYKDVVLKNDELKKINATQYQKLIDDRLKQKELDDIISGLKIELKNKPKTVIETVLVPVDKESPVDDVVVVNDSLTINDFYPQKKDYFVNYSARIDTESKKGIGRFSFQPVNVNLVLSQRKDGVYQLDTQVPEWMSVNNIEVRSLPLDVPRPDNFGLLLGVGYGKDFSKIREDYVRITTGVRWKKLYLEVGGNTNSTVDGGLKFEF